MYRNTKNVPYYVFGRGSLAQLGDLLKPRREAVDGPVGYFVDHFFRDHELIGRLPMEKGAQLHFVDSSSEPEVTRIDAFKEAVSAADSRTPCCVVGIGGGNALDTAKAVANLLTNPGKAEDYQGWELVKNPAVYKIGIPTLSGTGSECSRTCVLTNIPKNLKLGMNSDYTVYDLLLLDPDLLATVPRDQYFYTGIDTFMHCVESLQGSYRNAIINAITNRAVQLCQENILSDIYTIHNGLFSRIFTDNIFIKKCKCPIVRCRSQAHDKCIKIRQNLTPYIVNRSVAFIYDDDIKEFRMIFLIINHFFWCFTFSCRKLCK